MCSLKCKSSCVLRRAESRRWQTSVRLLLLRQFKASFKRHERNLKTAFSRWKYIICFPSTLRQMNLKRNNHLSYWICVWGKLDRDNHVIIVTSSFSKSSVLKIFSVHDKTPLCLCFKARLSAKPFLWKRTPWFSYERFRTQTRFETEAQENSEMAYSFALKSIFEKLCFPDGLMLKEDLTRRRINAAI